jgi:hypothetical protein
VIVFLGVDAFAKKRGIEKSTWSLPPPQPPKATSAAMMASEFVAFASPDTSFVQGSGCVKMPPTLLAAPPPELLVAPPLELVAAPPLELVAAPLLELLAEPPLELLAEPPLVLPVPLAASAFESLAC